MRKKNLKGAGRRIKVSLIKRELLSSLIIAFILISSISPVYGQAGVQTGGAVILTSDNVADLAVAHNYATKLGATVVVTKWGTFNESAFKQIIALSPLKVLIVGGEEAVPEAAEETLEKLGIRIKRFKGKDRYETAALVAMEWGNSSKIIIVQGDDRRGIREAENQAKSQGVPILYIKVEGVPTATINVTKLLGTQIAILISIPGVLPDEIKVKLKLKYVNETFKKDPWEKATEAIEEAREEIREANETISKAKAKNLNITAAEVLLENARKQLLNAEKAFNQTKYGEAFGQASAAERNAEDAKKIAEKKLELAEKKEEQRHELGVSAMKMIIKAAEKISDIEEDIIEAREEGFNVTLELLMLASAKAKLSDAEKALVAGNETQAKTLAIEARNLAVKAKKAIKAKEKEEKEEKEKKGEKED